MKLIETIGFIIGATILALLVLSFQAWLLGIVLGWFGFTLGFWKCFLIVFLLQMIVGGSRSSN